MYVNFFLGPASPPADNPVQIQSRDTLSQLNAGPDEMINTDFSSTPTPQSELTAPGFPEHQPSVITDFAGPPQAVSDFSAPPAPPLSLLDSSDSSFTAFDTKASGI